MSNDFLSQDSQWGEPSFSTSQCNVDSDLLKSAQRRYIYSYRWEAGSDLPLKGVSSAHQYAVVRKHTIAIAMSRDTKDKWNCDVGNGGARRIYGMRDSRMEWALPVSNLYMDSPLF